MARRTIRRHEHPCPNTILPAMLNFVSINATTKVFSVAAHLNSLVSLDASPAIFSSLGGMIPSAVFDRPSATEAMPSGFPAYVPFYVTAIFSMSSTMASEGTSTSVDAIAADGSTPMAMPSSQSGAAATIVLATPLSQGATASAVSTLPVESSAILTPSSTTPTSMPTPTSSHTLIPTPTDSSLASSLTVLSMTPDSTATSSAFTFTGCSISTCTPGYSNKHQSPHFNVFGLAVGLPIAIILILIVSLLLWQFFRRKSAWCHEPPDARQMWYRCLRRGGAAGKTSTANHKNHQVMFGKDVYDLGEPGPAFNLSGTESEYSRPLIVDIPTHTYKRKSTSSWRDPPFNPFRSTPLIDDDNHPARSKIGIALTRYSTAESAMPFSKPFSLEEENKIHNDSSTTLNRIHKRQSSTTISSNATTRVDGGTSGLQYAQVARRHSLTPRIINIIATGGSTDQISPGGNRDNDTSPTPAGLNRDSLRSRSISPNRLLSGYASFVDQMSTHHRQSTAQAHGPSRDTSNQPSSPSTSKTNSAGSTRIPVIPDRGRSVKREGNAHISFPPTAYPDLGETMAEVKKTIREKGGAAFASSEDLRGMARSSGNEQAVHRLPSSVTVTRGRGGK